MCSGLALAAIGDSLRCHAHMQLVSNAVGRGTTRTRSTASRPPRTSDTRYPRVWLMLPYVAIHASVPMFSPHGVDLRLAFKTMRALMSLVICRARSSSAA